MKCRLNGKDTYKRRTCRNKKSSVDHLICETHSFMAQFPHAISLKNVEVDRCSSVYFLSTELEPEPNTVLEVVTRFMYSNIGLLLGKCRSLF